MEDGISKDSNERKRGEKEPTHHERVKKRELEGRSRQSVDVLEQTSHGVSKVRYRRVERVSGIPVAIVKLNHCADKR